MTPFQLRKRLKRLLGLGAAPSSSSPKREDTTPRFTLIVVDSDGREETVQARINRTLLMAAGDLEHPIASGCSDSSCSTCRVEVLEGDDLLTPRDAQETATLAENNRDASLRLACITAVIKAGTVKVRAAEFLE